MKKDWVKARLIENGYDKAIVSSMYEDFIKETGAIWSKESYTRVVRRLYVELTEDIPNVDLSKDVVSLQSKNQKFSDLNNNLKKINRETYRLYNSLEEVYKEYISTMSLVDLSKINIKSHKVEANSKIGIIHISDNHFNEIIYECESHGNSYDFTIASKRLKKFITKAIKHFDDNKVKHCYIFFGGDTINSSRRLSEQLAQNSSLVRASLLATYLYQQVIIELSAKYKISVASVVGNESRLNEYMDSSDILSSENWDYLIFNNLRLIFNKKNIEFIESNNNISSIIRMPNGFNALLTHGHIFKSSQTVEKNVASLLQNYSYSGIKIHGVFMGHYHSSSIGDFISRSGSLCGANSYSAIDLMFLSRASQNIYIINNDLSYDGIKIDLQNTDNIVGYDLISELERYNVEKSSFNNKVVIQNLV